MLPEWQCHSEAVLRKILGWGTWYFKILRA